MKRDFCTRLSCLSCLLQFRGRLALFVRLFPHLSVAGDLQLEPIRERVNYGNADAVQAAGNFVGVAVEFSASMEHGEHNLGRRPLFGCMHVHGDAASVVDNGDGIIGVNGDIDLIRETGHRFVHRIVHHFPHQVMQAQVAGRADVHRRAQPHGLDAAENLDGLGVVLMARTFSRYRFFLTHVFSLAPRLLAEGCEPCAAARFHISKGKLLHSISAKFFLKRGKACSRTSWYVALPFDPDATSGLVGFLLHPVSRSETRRRLFHPEDRNPRG